MNALEEKEKKAKLKAEREFNFFIFQTRNGFRRPHMILNDGVRMSVQASAFHYCSPRKSCLSNYKEFEVGFPSEVIEQLREYAEYPAESDDELLKSVYLYVPKEVLVDIVYEHGGVNLETSLNKKIQLKELNQEKRILEEKNMKAQELINLFIAQLGNILEEE